ncbi:VanZ family protein [Jidongwangia harbinensis]|uniref:VanZ family protein n=1 Tax=Jidongwangia harbinensis TaxID=2878561 RepID=UPI001CDA008E|nr:VanZ family protein [Jidongwangia harbinensis]MCA2211931.1 VanZ family protein [Jidongwangia harbinensis]
MSEAFRDHGWVALTALLLVPALGGLPARLAAHRRMRRGVPPGPAWRHSLAEVAMVAGTVPWLVMAFTPQPAAGGVTAVPLRDLAVQLAGDPGTVLAQVTGNLLVFAAFGFAAPVRFRSLRPPLVGVLACAGSLAVEIGQYALDIGRVSSADDVLLNTLGAMAAAGLSRRWWSPASGDRSGVSRPAVRPVAGRQSPTGSTSESPSPQETSSATTAVPITDSTVTSTE